jgi:hypothetical protein
MDEEMEWIVRYPVEIPLDLSQVSNSPASDKATASSSECSGTDIEDNELLCEEKLITANNHPRPLVLGGSTTSKRQKCSPTSAMTKIESDLIIGRHRHNEPAAMRTRKNPWSCIPTMHTTFDSRHRFRPSVTHNFGPVHTSHRGADIRDLVGADNVVFYPGTESPDMPASGLVTVEDLLSNKYTVIRKGDTALFNTPVHAALLEVLLHQVRSLASRTEEIPKRCTVLLAPGSSGASSCLNSLCSMVPRMEKDVMGVYMSLDKLPHDHNSVFRKLSLAQLIIGLLFTHGISMHPAVANMNIMEDIRSNSSYDSFVATSCAAEMMLAAGKRLFVVIDDFDELYALCGNEVPTATETLRDLYHFGQQKLNCVSVILTGSAPMLSNIANYPGHFPACALEQYPLLHTGAVDIASSIFRTLLINSCSPRDLLISMANVINQDALTKKVSRRAGDTFIRLATFITGACPGKILQLVDLSAFQKNAITIDWDGSAAMRLALQPMWLTERASGDGNESLLLHLQRQVCTMIIQANKELLAAVFTNDHQDIRTGEIANNIRNVNWEECLRPIMYGDLLDKWVHVVLPCIRQGFIGSEGHDKLDLRYYMLQLYQLGTISILFEGLEPVYIFPGSLKLLAHYLLPEDGSKREIGLTILNCLDRNGVDEMSAIAINSGMHVFPRFPLPCDCVIS